MHLGIETDLNPGIYYILCMLIIDMLIKMEKIEDIK